MARIRLTPGYDVVLRTPGARARRNEPMSLAQQVADLSPIAIRPRRVADDANGADAAGDGAGGDGPGQVPNNPPRLQLQVIHHPPMQIPFGTGDGLVPGGIHLGPQVAGDPVHGPGPATSHVEQEGLLTGNRHRYLGRANLDEQRLDTAAPPTLDQLLPGIAALPGSSLLQQRHTVKRIEQFLALTAAPVGDTQDMNQFLAQQLDGGGLPRQKQRLALELAKAYDHLSPGDVRDRLDEMAQSYARPLLRNIREATVAAEKNAVAGLALRSLCNSGVPQEERNGLAVALTTKRGVLMPQLRIADEHGRAPALLRQHAMPLLNAFKAQLKQLEAANMQPRVAQWDTLVLPLLIESQNARTPGLNLRLTTHDQLAAEIRQHQGRDSESIAIVDVGALGLSGKMHHTAAHTMTQASKPPKLSFLDSHTNPEMAAYQVLRALPAGSEAVPVELKTQNAMECVIFALSTSKKINDHRPQVQALYGQPDVPGRPPGMKPAVEGTDHLPPTFFKHSQSRKTLDRLRDGPQGVDLTQPVNKKNDTLYTRWDKHRVQRTEPPAEEGDPPKTARYNASIEQKRLTFIDQALAHFNP